VVLDGSYGLLGSQEIESVATAWRATLIAHERTGTPVTVHVTGSLIEAFAWHAPDVLDHIRSLHADRLLGVLGTTCTEAPLSNTPSAIAALQVTEGLRILEHHLGIDPTALTAAWVPMRQWSTESVAPILTDPSLPNGGFSWVLLEERTLLAAGDPYRRSPRGRFDDLMARLDEGPSASVAAELAQHLLVRRVAGTSLGAVPVSSALPRWLPLRDSDDLRWWRDMAFAVSRAAVERSILLWVGNPLTILDDEGSAGHYEHSLSRLSREAPISFVDVPRWLSRRRATEEARVEPTDEEVPDDVNGFRPTRSWLERATARTFELVDGTDGGLAALARRQLLAMWQEPALLPDDARDSPAVARASQARTAPVLASAARWLAVRRDLAWAEVHDVDDDGEEEIIMGSDRLHLVVAPAHGARIVSLAVATAAGGALAIGNPADDWGEVIAVNSSPPPLRAHPGALLLVDGEDDRWEVISVSEPGPEVVVELEDVEAASRHCGTHLRLQLAADGDTVVATYSNLSRDTVVLSGLSPDYSQLLSGGSSAMEVQVDDDGCVAVAGQVRLRIGSPPQRGGNISLWRDHPYAVPSHAHLVALRVRGSEITVHIGASEIVPDVEEAG
jgi:hypothetical protein